MKWKDVLFSWIGRINIVKMVKVPKAIYKFNESSSKSQWHFFKEMEQNIKIYRNHKIPYIAK